ncbi:MAG: hypothetical protein AAF791_07880 [Bacteroidota bacterium]
MRCLVFALLLPVASVAQDLQIQFHFPDSAQAEVDEALLQTPNVTQAYELDIDGDGWTERLLLSFTPREVIPQHASLNNFVAFTHEAFQERIPDRVISSIAVDVEANPLDRAGLPFAAYGFFRPTPEGTPPTCDSAALFFESDGGFWTLSWNAPRGWLRGDLGGVFGLIRTMEIRRPEPAYATIQANPEPVSFDASELAVIR